MLATSVAHGSPLVVVPIAFVAGFASFFSPCVLPLVPGYVAFLGGATGVEAAAPARAHRPGRALAGAIAFVLGFSLVFISLGSVFGGFGQSLHAHERGIQVVLGSLTILMGLAFAGWLPRSSLLNREARVHYLPSATVGGADLLGVPFLLAAVAADQLAVVARFARRHTVALLRLGGAVLVVIGVLEVTGTWASMVQWLQDHVATAPLP